MVFPHQVGGKAGMDRQEEELVADVDLPDQVSALLHYSVFL